MSCPDAADDSTIKVFNAIKVIIGHVFEDLANDMAARCGQIPSDDLHDHVQSLVDSLHKDFGNLPGAIDLHRALAREFPEGSSEIFAAALTCIVGVLISGILWIIGVDPDHFRPGDAARRRKFALPYPSLTHLERPGARRATSRHPPGTVVVTVTAIACRLLPAIHQARYAQEFRAELFELPRRSRLAYALRQLWVAPALRRDLADWPSTDPAAERQTSP
jgi:hypothetical protein